MEEKDFQKRIQRVEQLVQEIEASADSETRARALELVQSLMDFHGAALERMMELVAETGEAGYAIFDGFAADEMSSSMLLLYGLHPLSIETRVMRALDKVRPYLSSHGGNVELLGVNDGVVHLRFEGSCKGCPSSAMTLKLAVEEAIYESAPDVISIEADGVVAEPVPAFVQLGRRAGENGKDAQHNGKGKWEQVSGLDLLAQTPVQALDVSGHSVLFCRLGEELYAYGNSCPGCGLALHGARLEAGSLVCNGCEQDYDVMRAGRGLSQPSLQLKPFPLLIEQGQAKIALPH